MMSHEPPDGSHESSSSLLARKQARKKKLLAGVKSVRRTAGKVGKTLQKVNIGKWIDDLENDQHLADQLDRINTENEDDQFRRDLKREAEDACYETIKTHLMAFVDKYPTATYEDWIEDLHPENMLDSERKTIDHRFYVQDSDHRVLWNMTLVDKERKIARVYVPVRSLSMASSTVSTIGMPSEDASSGDQP